MKKKANFKFIKLSVMVSGIMTLAILSCSKEENQEVPSELQQVQLIAEMAEDDALATEEFSSIFEFVMDESSSIDPTGKVVASSENLPPCAIVTHDPATRTLTIDFGSEGCIGRDGLTRSGSIMAVFSGTRGETGASVTVTLEAYKVEGFTFEGSKTITNSTALEGMESFSIKVTDARITGPAGKTRSWNSDHTVTRIAGADTLRPFDDIYETTGSASGVDRNGNNFTRTITVPLIKNRQIGCLRNYISGVLVVQNDRFGSDLVIDFGDGTCDRKASVTYNGNTREIILR